MYELSWKDCKITIATNTTYSAEVDLGRPCDYVDVYIPTITSANLSLYAAEQSGGTFKPVGSNLVYAAGTGDHFTVFKCKGFQYIKLVSSVAQEANRTFRVRGIRN